MFGSKGYLHFGQYDNINMPKEKKDKKSKKEKVKKVKASGKGVKMADMSATAVIIDVGAQLPVRPLADDAPAPKTPRVRGKNYLQAKKMIDKSKVYPIKEAIELLKKLSLAKFDQTVELHLNVLEKGLFGEVNLPYFKGKARKIAIFTDELGVEIKSGKINFDILLATPSDMPKILPLAKILGPKGLMPNPKNGTVVPIPEKALEKFGAGAVHFKTEKDFPLIHTVVGKLNQPTEELTANFEVFIKAVKPQNITKAVIKSTMSPSVKIAF